ncbi:MAG: acyltransferase family protein [Clostridiales bacterium]|nr:acyltransferase family protein [Clostridiales bacterium]
MTKRNGKIEFYRFIFCLCILWYHAGSILRGDPALNMGIHPEFFPHGNMAVEFFFLVNGFFFARSISKKVEADESRDHLLTNKELSKEYTGFLINKYKNIFIVHLPIYLFSLLVAMFVDPLPLVDTVIRLVDNIPSLFLLQMTGWEMQGSNVIEWYLSAMLIAMAILYPICRKYYYTMTRYFIPLFGVLTFGVMWKNTGYVTGVVTWLGFVFKGSVRGIVEIGLGMTCYEIAKWLQNKYWDCKKISVLLLIAETVSFLCIITYVILTINKSYEIFIIPLMMILVISAGSGITCGSCFFDKKTVMFLGRLSFSLYLSQLSAIYLAEYFGADLRIRYQVIVATVLAFALALGTDKVGAYLKKKLC